jgi:hypothetical protein
MNTNCEQVLNYCCSGSRGNYTIGNTTLNVIISVVFFLGFWPRRSNGDTYFMLTDFLAIQKILGQILYKQLLHVMHKT